MIKITHSPFCKNGTLNFDDKIEFHWSFDIENRSTAFLVKAEEDVIVSVALPYIGVFNVKVNELSKETTLNLYKKAMYGGVETGIFFKDGILSLSLFHDLSGFSKISSWVYNKKYTIDLIDLFAGQKETDTTIVSMENLIVPTPSQDYNAIYLVEMITEKRRWSAHTYKISSLLLMDEEGNTTYERTTAYASKEEMITYMQLVLEKRAKAYDRQITARIDALFDELKAMKGEHDE